MVANKGKRKRNVLEGYQGFHRIARNLQNQAQKIGRSQRILGSKFYRKCHRMSQLGKLLLELLPVATCPCISGQSTHNDYQEPLLAPASPCQVWVTCLQPSIWEERKELPVSLHQDPFLFCNGCQTWKANRHISDKCPLQVSLSYDCMLAECPSQSLPLVPDAETYYFSMLVVFSVLASLLT